MHKYKKKHWTLIDFSYFSRPSDYKSVVDYSSPNITRKRTLPSDFSAYRASVHYPQLALPLPLSYQGRMPYAPARTRWRRNARRRNVRRYYGRGRGRGHPFRRQRSGLPTIRRYRNPLAIYPDVMQTKMIAFQSTSTFVAAPNDTLHFHGNSAFDPFAAEGTIQPQGLDQMGTFYTRYRVTASAVLVRIMQKDANPLTVVVFPQRLITAPTSIAHAASMPASKVANLTGADDRRVIKNYATTKKLYAGEDVVGTNFQALFTANPSSIWYWIMYLTNSGANLNCLVETTMILYVSFFDRKIIPISEV